MDDLAFLSSSLFVMAINSTSLQLNIDLPQSFITDNNFLFGKVMSFNSPIKLN